MPRRYEHSAVTAAASLRPASALRFAIRHGCRTADLRADLLPHRLHASRVFVVAAGIRPQARVLTRKAGWDRREWLVVLGSLGEAIVPARSLSGSDIAGGAPLDGGTTPSIP